MSKIVILKKEQEPSLTIMKWFRFRGLSYWLYALKGKLKGYEVEFLDDKGI